MTELWKQILICLVAAHIVGDFVFQSDNTAKKKHQLLVLMRHSLVVAILSYVLCGLWRGWEVPIAVPLTHALVDYLKTVLARPTIRAFTIDQGAHLSVLVGLALALTQWSLLPAGARPVWVQLFGTGYLKGLIAVAGFVFAVKGGAVVIGLGIQPLLGEMERQRKQAGSDTSHEARGFEQGGKIIGQLERILIYLLVMIGQPAGIGFLVAAKSVFRFGELKDHQRRMEAEYIIIGTLMSFGFAMTVAFITEYLMSLA